MAVGGFVPGECGVKGREVLSEGGSPGGSPPLPAHLLLSSSHFDLSLTKNILVFVSISEIN